MFARNRLLILISIFLLVYLWLRGSLFLDPDYGWHLREGQLILSHGVPRTDPFSYTMSSYPYVDHEWLTNVLLAKGIDILTYKGVAGVFALIAMGALLLSVLAQKKVSFRFALIPFFLTGMTFYSFAGVRPQIISWFFFALLLWIVRQEERFLRLRWLLPLVFFAWANLHGGFALGMMTLILVCGYWYVKKKSSLRSLLLLVGLCLLATCLTPYGYRMWWEVWMSMSDSSLRFTIQEWLPAVFSMDLALWLFAALSVSLVIRNLRKFSLLDRMLYFLLLFSGIASIRQMPFWLLIALPMTIEAIGFFFVEIQKIPHGERRFRIMGRALGVLAVLFCLPSLWTTAAGLGVVGGTSVYPDKAISFLAKQQLKGEVFSTYDWGGYLIWKLPEKKVFIDGRMPSWRRSEDVPEESKYAFDDYRKFVDGKTPFTKTINKYHITAFLLPVPADPSQDQFVSKIRDFGVNVLHWPLRKDIGYTHLVKEAKKAGWKEVYKDDTAVVYLKEL